MRDSTSKIQCVFLDFLIESSILSIGQWSDRGCHRSENLSNTSVTVCKCNHLAHFAILLRPITIGDILQQAETNALSDVSITQCQQFPTLTDIPFRFSAILS